MDCNVLFCEYLRVGGVCCVCGGGGGLCIDGSICCIFDCLCLCVLVGLVCVW
jgi:hypothetical protein